MTKKEQLYEGKAKKVFATEEPELLIVSYKDDATAFNGLKKGTIVGKGLTLPVKFAFIFKPRRNYGGAGVRGCSTTASAPAFQAGDVGSIPITRSIKKVFNEGFLFLALCQMLG